MKESLAIHKIRVEKIKKTIELVHKITEHADSKVKPIRDKMGQIVINKMDRPDGWRDICDLSGAIGHYQDALSLLFSAYYLLIEVGIRPKKNSETIRYLMDRIDNDESNFYLVYEAESEPAK